MTMKNRKKNKISVITSLMTMETRERNRINEMTSQFTTRSRKKNKIGRDDEFGHRLEVF